MGGIIAVYIMELKELIELLDKSSLSFLEFKTEEYYIKLDKSFSREESSESKNHDLISDNKSTAHNSKQNSVNDEENKKAAESSNFKAEVLEEKSTFVIKSPMVGSFYSSPSPEDKPYATIGSNVKKGEVVCIIEAMKLMNEIECEDDGEVIEILCKDGDLVEYGQPLFKIRKVK